MMWTASLERRDAEMGYRASLVPWLSAETIRHLKRWERAERTLAEAGTGQLKTKEGSKHASVHQEGTFPMPKE